MSDICLVCGTPLKYSRFCSTKSGFVDRTQREPRYSDDEMKPFFDMVSRGYCCKQASHKAGMSYVTIENTLFSDDEVMEYMLLLSMEAGNLIRGGNKPAPEDRWDDLYDKFLTEEELAKKSI